MLDLLLRLLNELTGGEKELVCTNYYTGKEVKIPLDPQLTARENSQKYFDKYGIRRRKGSGMGGL